MAALMMRSSTLAGKVATTRRSVAARAAGSWAPGTEPPAHLKVDIPGNYGFDPCGLAKEPGSLAWFREAEVIHCRWAMLGAAGALAPELFGFGNWYDAPLPTLNGGHATYFGAEVPFDLKTLLAVELVAIGGAEKLRLENTGERIYPGGSFDPLGFSKSANLEEYKWKEIKNGRLAMIACAGFAFQHAATGKAPLAALGAHLSDPWGQNCGTNGISIPF